MSTIHVVQRWKIHSIILSAFPSVKSFCELIAGQFLIKYILLQESYVVNPQKNKTKNSNPENLN